MIVKELDPFSSDDPLARAGRAAEEQMAFYLKRAFAADPRIVVLNGVRLERDGDAAQMDHLVIHRYGVTIVESKSVTGIVRVNTHGEWVRVYGKRVEGMASPILQAERQADFLKRYCKAYADQLPTKELGVFRKVAISDKGVIERPKDLDLDAVCKADQLPGVLAQFLSARKVLKAMPSFVGNALIAVARGEAGDVLAQQEVTAVARFLLRHHLARPVTRTDRQPLRVKHQHSPAQSTAVACRACGSAHLRVDYKYSYFYRCLDCAGATPIGHTCQTCGGTAKIRKSGQDFFRECAACSTSSLFHSNPA